MDDKSDTRINEEQGLAWKVSFSILVVVGWFIFLIFWLFFLCQELCMRAKYHNIPAIYLHFRCGRRGPPDVLGVEKTIICVKRNVKEERIPLARLGLDNHGGKRHYFF